MASLDLGAKATVKWPTAPDTGPYALAVKKPDGTTLDPAPEVTGYRESAQAEFVPPMAGRYLLSWTAGGAGAYTDVLDVWPADPQFLIPLDEVLTGLRLPSNADPAKAQDLRLYLAAATPVIEDITGPMLAATKTYTTWGGDSAVVLPDLPTEILGITADGAAVTAYVPDLASGLVYAGTRSAVTVFPGGELVVTYRIGSAEIPPNIRLAARELVRFWWQGGMQGSGGGTIRGVQQDTDAFTPSGYAVPRRVIELCAPHQQMGGFA
ncbi:hypothetical protein [Arthrobacter sp. ISL-72]|uniref:hypothetical protein n=1 Tax=Arthrobacter sp. ISL-72 TaxID=2819114 RepID=UPI001BEBE00B|nr:hypothetical protein [Arthrobacter sp. ISL-72]MBT2594736.1 hypothetical protein [Arthrobacter sp. ISL-72]